MSAAKRRHLVDSPAACLLDQARESRAAAARIRRRRVESALPVEAPGGALGTFLSAGSFGLPDEKRWRRRFAVCRPRLAVAIGLAMALIWIFF